MEPDVNQSPSLTQPPADEQAVEQAVPTQRATLVAARERHWQRTRTLSMTLLALWLVTTFGTAFYARELATLSLFGWPLSFYFAAQGASLIYLAIIVAYAFCMRRIDRRYRHQLKDSA
jgi:putative solute:sodium symporter small subunit